MAAEMAWPRTTNRPQRTALVIRSLGHRLCSSGFLGRRVTVSASIEPQGQLEALPGSAPDGHEKERAEKRFADFEVEVIPRLGARSCVTPMQVASVLKGG